MAIFKCKMCGGELELNKGASVAECPYCGSQQTVPFLDDDKKTRLYSRANQYRLNNEFDKAYAAYETIIAEKEDEAEAYWGLILSEYGVEYVEDPKSKKRIPTCHRTIIRSVTSNENYKLACQYADSESKMMYEDEAEEIDRLQKQILNISAKEDPYDAFICYKESDENGERTSDSVLAQEIYDELTRNGLRVFFSRITLEDKLGKDYEPYIFAALTSAKVMLVVTTNSDHCNAVWVKNEWKRYLAFMENDKDKVLIPVYKDISPYTLPDEFVKLQAQDMSKLGAVQDLVRGMRKIVGNSVGEASLDKKQKNLLEKYEKSLKRRKRFFAIVLPSFALVIALLIGVYFLPFTQNYIGDLYFKSGKYSQAYDYYERANSYQGNIPKAIVAKQLNEFATAIRNGQETVYFGCYEQDGDFDNGLEEIEWQVLENNDGQIMLKSAKILDYVASENYPSSSYKKSNIYSWLNSDFYNSAFSHEHQVFLYGNVDLPTKQQISNNSMIIGSIDITKYAKDIKITLYGSDTYFWSRSGNIQLTPMNERGQTDFQISYREGNKMVKRPVNGTDPMGVMPVITIDMSKFVN